MPNCRLNNYTLSDRFVCIHHLINIVFFPCNYGVHQKESNKRTSAALISVAYRAPRLSLCVCCTLTLSLKVPSCKIPQSLDCRRFSRENAARFAESRRVGKNRGVWQKAPQYTSRTNPEANYKSAAHFLSKSGAQFFY